MWPAQVSKHKNAKEGTYLQSPNICDKKRMFNVRKENSQLSFPSSKIMNEVETKNWIDIDPELPVFFLSLPPE